MTHPTKPQTCPRCYGHGPEADCPVCKGTGYIPTKLQGETPRTNKAVKVDGRILNIVTADFARTLERALSGCQMELEDAKKTIATQTDALRQAATRLASPAEREGTDELSRHLDGEHHAIVAQQIDSPMNACMLKPTCLWLKKLALSHSAPSLQADGLAEDEVRQILSDQFFAVSPHIRERVVERIIAALRSRQAPRGEGAVREF